MRRAQVGLVVYLFFVVVAALLGGILHDAVEPMMWTVKRAAPALTVRVQESLAQAAVFVPVGWLLARSVPRRPELVLPAGLLVVMSVVSLRPDFFTQRTLTVLALAAHLSGLCAGLLIAAARSARRDRDALRTP